MIGNKKLLAIIPARGGSKRLPRKNILDLGGKPLIAWTIEAAKKSKHIDEIIVSTEDKEIVEICKRFSLDVPFLREEELAADGVSSVAVVLDVLSKLKLLRNSYYDYIILLQPTSPLRTEKDIDGAVKLLINKKCNGVISVCEVKHSPLWYNKLPKNNSLSGFLDKSIVNKRSQDLEKYYRLNGAIYLLKSNVIKEKKTFMLEDSCYAYRMSEENSIDIDDKIDLDLARLCIDSK